MIRGRPLPSDIARRLSTLGQALERCPPIVFAHLFGSAAGGRLTPLSDVDVLAETGMLPGPERDAMGRMVGFRNVIVHEDARVDAEIVVRSLRQHLGDLTRLGTTARAWV